MSIQIKIAVICNIKNGIRIRCPMIMDCHFVLIRQSISYFNMCLSRISLISIRAVKRQHNMFFICFFYLPHPLTVEIKPTVQIVFKVILCKLISFSIYRKAGSFDAVRIPSDNCTKKCTALFIAGHIIIPKYYITDSSIFIGSKDTDKSCSVIGYRNLHSFFITQCIKRSILTFLCDSKIFLHLPNLPCFH